jgi:hypothetical protein
MNCLRQFLYVFFDYPVILIVLFLGSCDQVDRLLLGKSTCFIIDSRQNDKVIITIICIEFLCKVCNHSVLSNPLEMGNKKALSFAFATFTFFLAYLF